MIIRFFLLLALCLSSLFSKPLSYEEILKKPQSIAKDYYIYRLLNEGNITKKEVETLYPLAKRMSPTLNKLFVAKIDSSDLIKKEVRCRGLSAQDMLGTNDEKCIMLRVSPSIVSHLNSTQKSKLTDILQNNPYTKSWVSAMNSKDVHNKLIKTGPKQFLTVFNGSQLKYKKEQLDKPLPEDFIRSLEGEKGFEMMLRDIVYQEEYLSSIPKSLLYIPNKESNLTHQAAFLLGLNALKKSHPKLADMFFIQAHKKAYYQSEKDKSLFWRYLIANDEKILELITKSPDINIYSLYAKEHFDVELDNVHYIIASSNKSVDFDMLNPFDWTMLLDKIKASSNDELQALIQKYDSSLTLPIFAFLLERYSNYKQSYFITPYSELLEDEDIRKKILIYSIARQESRFVPASISTSYALGMMQFMPFLARDIAKNKKMKNFDLDDMFKPEIAYNFASTHLDYLDKYLHHPLFIAYAYNGGIGFTKRMLQTNKFKEGKYEPFMSIETISYNETREYGKKVLSNYVVYSKLLGEDVSIKNLFEELSSPLKTDKFRH